MKERHYVECACGEAGHVLRFTWWPDEDPDMEFIAVDVFLDENGGFFRRLWAGVKYILGFKSRFGHFGETVLEREQIEKLEGMFGRWMRENVLSGCDLERRIAMFRKRTDYHLEKAEENRRMLLRLSAQQREEKSE